MKYYPVRTYLSEARDRLGYSQYRAAAEMGVCHQHYQRIESGRIGLAIQFRTISALATALDIPINVIWEEEIKYQRRLITEDDNY